MVHVVKGRKVPKHADRLRGFCDVHYENKPIQIYRKFHPQKTENFQIKNSDIFQISARRGGSNEYPQSKFCAEIRKILYTPVNPSFTV